MKVSICLINKNNGKYTGQFIPTLQKFRDNLAFKSEVVLVDDHSNDGSFEELESVADVAVQEETNRGEAKNLCHELATGDVLIDQVDTDNTVLHTLTTTTNYYCDENPEWSLITNRIDREVDADTISPVLHNANTLEDYEYANTQIAEDTKLWDDLFDDELLKYVSYNTIKHLNHDHSHGNPSVDSRYNPRHNWPMQSAWDVHDQELENRLKSLHNLKLFNQYCENAAAYCRNFNSGFGYELHSDAELQQDYIEVQRLVERVRQHNPNTFLEVGSRWGGFVYVMVESLNLDTAVAVDLPDQHRLDEKFMRHLNYDTDVRCVYGNSQDQTTIDEIVDQYDANSIDFIHIDGSHQYSDVEQDLMNYYELLSEDGVMAFHDIVSPQDQFDADQFWEDYKNTYNFDEIINWMNSPVEINGTHLDHGIGIIEK